MRERSRDIDRLLHIREAINSINTYLNGRTMGTMYKDPMCSYTNNLPPLLAQIEQYIQTENQETMKY